MNPYLKYILPSFILRKIDRKEKELELINWEKNGKPNPTPHLIKQQIIKDYQSKYKASILVETGTYLGDMVEAQKKNFKKVYSIELSEKLAAKAQKRFKKDQHIQIIQGDSGTKLSFILENIEEPAIFWLDGHYSEGITAKGDKNCPIFEEVDAIFNASSINHILLIDDARYFIGAEDYPTIEELSTKIKSKNPSYSITVENDIIRAVPY